MLMPEDESEDEHEDEHEGDGVRPRQMVTGSGPNPGVIHHVKGRVQVRDWQRTGSSVPLRYTDDYSPIPDR